MKFSWLLLFFTVSVTVPLIPAQESGGISLIEKTLLEREQLGWRYLTEKKFDDFARLLGKDFQGVYDNRLTGKNQELARLKTQTPNFADLTNLKVSFPNPETAIVISEIKLEHTETSGRLAAEKLRCATVYVKRGFEWQIVMRSHFPLKE